MRYLIRSFNAQCSNSARSQKDRSRLHRDRCSFLALAYRGVTIIESIA